VSAISFMHRNLLLLRQFTGKMMNAGRTLRLISSKLSPSASSKAAPFTTRARSPQTAFHGRETSLIEFCGTPFLGAVSIPQAPVRVPLKYFSAIPTNSSSNWRSRKWSNWRPIWNKSPPGCDYEHWLILMWGPPEGTRDEIIDSYIKTLAQVVGSEEEARMKIYSVSTKHYFAFGFLGSEELADKIEIVRFSRKFPGLHNIRWVLPDSYLDPQTKDYGGEPFINGQAVPYDPKYHEVWVRSPVKPVR